MFLTRRDCDSCQYSLHRPTALKDSQAELTWVAGEMPRPTRVHPSHMFRSSLKYNVLMLITWKHDQRNANVTKVWKKNSLKRYIIAIASLEKVYWSSRSICSPRYSRKCLVISLMHRVFLRFRQWLLVPFLFSSIVNIHDQFRHEILVPWTSWRVWLDRVCFYALRESIIPNTLSFPCTVWFTLHIHYNSVSNLSYQLFTRIFY